MILGLRVYRVQDVGSGLRVWGWGFSVVVFAFVGLPLDVLFKFLLGGPFRASSTVVFFCFRPPVYDRTRGARLAGGLSDSEIERLSGS